MLSDGRKGTRETVPRDLKDKHRYRILRVYAFTRACAIDRRKEGPWERKNGLLTSGS